MKMLHYFWTYAFVRDLVWVSLAAIIAVLLFYGITSGVVARKSRKTGAKRALTILQLNTMSHEKEVHK